MKVKDVMHKGAVCVAPTTLVSEIAAQMRDDDIGVMPVKADGHLIGIVTDRDIACRAVPGGKDLGQMTAKDIMTSKVVCCLADDDVAKAVKTMEAKRIRRLPVTDSGENIVGILSLGDISHKVGDEMSGEVLRAVSAHHR
jgi:CBS domain-containing protein